MPISITCPQCRKQHSAPDALAGKAAKCKCGTVIQIPRTKEVMAAAMAMPATGSIFDELTQEDLEARRRGSKSVGELVVCENRSERGEVWQRIEFDPAARTVTFENCHVSRAFFSFGYESARVVSFEEILASHDFMQGDNQAYGFRALLGFVKVTHHPFGRISSQEQPSMFISTAYGRCQVFSDWHNFAALRMAIRQIAPHGKGGYWEDNPTSMALMAIGAITIIVVIVWLLL